MKSIANKFARLHNREFTLLNRTYCDDPTEKVRTTEKPKRSSSAQIDSNIVDFVIVVNVFGSIHVIMSSMVAYRDF